MIQQVHDKKKSSNKRKAIIITATACVLIIAVCAVVFISIKIHRQRMEIQTHIINATEYIENGANRISVKTNMIVAFYMLIDRAEHLTDITEYDAAINVYEEARIVALAVSYAGGIDIAESGVIHVHELILTAKRNEAMTLFVQGNDLYNEALYKESLDYFFKALDIYVELNDNQNIFLTTARINYAEQKIIERENEQNPDPDGTEDDSEDENIIEDDTTPENDPSDNITSNYKHNRSIYFDLITPVDHQSRRPASDIRMGVNEGYNEGWYNGCGWIATYNALIILGKPVHPAEIVRSFETNVGIVLGGVFGTYPNAIVDYLNYMGFNVTHTLFPQLTMNIDEVIKSSKVSILAYAHTSAAHYIAIEYREDIDKFIVYNDSFARVRSENLVFQNETNAGAAIDSVAALISNTPNILFSFSLIVVS